MSFLFASSLCVGCFMGETWIISPYKQPNSLSNPTLQTQEIPTISSSNVSRHNHLNFLSEHIYIYPFKLMNN